MPRPLISAVAAGVVVMALTACSGGSSSGTKSADTIPADAAAVVDIKNIAFNAHTVTINAGQTVGWKFDDGSIAHNVTFSTFRSPDRTSGTFTHTFATAGDYRYNCTIHSGMDGEVVVK
jgi:plastocyanin